MDTYSTRSSTRIYAMVDSEFCFTSKTYTDYDSLTNYGCPYIVNQKINRLIIMNVFTMKNENVNMNFRELSNNQF